MVLVALDDHLWYAFQLVTPKSTCRGCIATDGRDYGEKPGNHFTKRLQDLDFIRHSKATAAYSAPKKQNHKVKVVLKSAFLF